MTLKLAVVSALALLVGIGIGWYRPEPAEVDREMGPTHASKSARGRSGPSPAERSASDRAEAKRMLSRATGPDRMRALVRFANRIPTSSLAGWTDRGVLPTKDGLEEEVFRRIVVGRLTAGDPGSALALIARESGRELDAKLRAWMAEDPEAALRFIIDADPGLQWRLSVIALREWARVDPRRALILLDGVARRNKVELAWQLVRELPPLAESHADELVELARHWPSQWRHCIQVAAAKTAWMKDPVGTVEWMQAQAMSAEVFAQVIGDLANEFGGREMERLPDVLAHLRSIPEAWLETAARRADYAVVRRNSLGWLQASADELGIAPALHDKLQCAAASQLPGEVDPASLMAGATTTVQAALAVKTVERLFYTDRDAVEPWMGALEDPSVREAALRRFRQLAEPRKAYPWRYDRQ